MALPAFKKLQSEDPVLNKVQGYIKDQFELINAPFVRGRYLTEISNGQETNLLSITTSDKNFEHKLGRNIEGYLIIEQRASSIIWRSSTVNENLFLTLRGSANVTAKVWVF